MDLTKYEKTRYQNIYRNKKNKNYIVMMSKPIKTSIASIDGKKIFKLDEALKIRDDYKIKKQKSMSIKSETDFDYLLKKYLDYCKYDLKLSYNTIKKKERLFNKCFFGKFKKITSIKRELLSKYIDELDTTTKQKNEIIKIIKPFFNWCVKNEIILINPMANIKEYKVTKPQMLFWTPDEIKSFFDYLNNEIENNINKEIAWRIKLFVLISFNLGNRVGETRALTFSSFVKEKQLVKIHHSINYDTSSNDYLSNTKTYYSQREITVSNKLIKELEEYKWFLLNETDYEINDNDLIFCNFNTKKPLSDTLLRKQFHTYCEKAKVSKIRLYDLRHTYVATMMLEGKELYHISERLGHTNFSTTVNKYGHLSNQVRKEIAEITDKYY